MNNEREVWHKNGLVKPLSESDIIVKMVDGTMYDNIEYINGYWFQNVDDNTKQFVKDSNIACWAYNDDEVKE